MQGNDNDRSTTTACIDAETLAAWADGGLSSSAAASVEVHLADCERCTAMLATFVRTTPETPVAESLWQRWHLRWLVPIATAATVAALWVIVPRPGSEPTGTPESAALTAAPAPAPAASQPSPIEDAKAQEPAAAAVPPATTDTDAFARSEKATEAKAAPVAPRLAERERSVNELREQEGRAIADARSAEPATPPPPAAAAPAPPPPTRELDRADQNATAPREAAAAPASRSPIGAARRQGNLQGFAAVVAQVEVVSPDRMTRWRVIGAGQVERSTDGGANWQSATLPESATLTAGISPAPSICWLVGRTGSIYVTTDGLRFIKVPFIDRSDFVSIQAIDARRATVITIDGRTMRTEDQGSTWVRVSP